MNTPCHTIPPIAPLWCPRYAIVLRFIVTIEETIRVSQPYDEERYEVVRLSQALRNVELGHNQLVRLDGTS